MRGVHDTGVVELVLVGPMQHPSHDASPSLHASLWRLPPLALALLAHTTLVSLPSLSCPSGSRAVSHHSP